MAGLMSELFISRKSGEAEMAHKKRQIQSWCKSRSLDRQMKAQIISHFEAQYEQSGQYYDEDKILKELPPTLANRVAAVLYNDIVVCVPFFRGLSRRTRHALFRIIKHHRIGMNSVIFDESDIGSEMYLLCDGEVEVLREGERLGFLGPGAFFGESPIIEAVYGSRYIARQQTRVRTVRTTIETEIGVITRAGIVELWEQYSELKDCIRTFAKRINVGSKSDPRVSGLVKVVHGAAKARIGKHTLFREHVFRLCALDRVLL